MCNLLRKNSIPDHYHFFLLRQLSDSSSNYDSDESNSWPKSAPKKVTKRPSKLNQFRAKIQGRKAVKGERSDRTVLLHYFLQGQGVADQSNT